MSRIWAIVSEDSGLVVQTIHQDFGGLVEGSQYGEGYIARDISNTGWEAINTKCYWHIENECWETLPPKPEGEYYFENHGWVFDSDMFGLVLRADRTKKLQECDWTQMPDSPLDEAAKQDWATYRQSLRDMPDSVPSDCHSIYAVVWPNEPS